MNNSTKREVVLALHPTTRGLGYCAFEKPEQPLDWGYADIRVCRRRRMLDKAAVLVRLYQPTVVVLDDIGSLSEKQIKVISRLVPAITEAMVGQGIPVVHYSSDQLDLAFGKVSKFERARSIAQFLPQLRPHLPPRRRAFDPEHPQMQMFEAVSLALTYFYLDT